MELTAFQRALISRAAMAVMALALLYGARACLRASARIAADDLAQTRARSPHGRVNDRDVDNSGTQLPSLIGIGLICLGVPFLLGAVLPNRVLYSLPFFAQPDTGREEIEEMFRQ